MDRLQMTLKACRVNANLRIKDVALALNKTERTIKNWESGKTIPNGLELRKLSSLYNIGCDFIFLGNEIALNEFYTRGNDKKN